jgi:Sec-independent protein translocase protein TatA
LPIYVAEVMPYLMRMPGVSTSELAIVVFILLLVIVAGRLPRWGEALGSYLYRRRKPGSSGESASASHDESGARTPGGTGTSSEAQPPH